MKKSRSQLSGSTEGPDARTIFGHDIPSPPTPTPYVWLAGVDRFIFLKKMKTEILGFRVPQPLFGLEHSDPMGHR